ncbi:MAG: thymidine phosphorylase [Holophagaceae bacterium]|nr:thymidine phosphorylase [Holophagaceae bacterium]
MRMYDLVYAKKSGEALSGEAIAWWVRGVTNGTIPDEQSAALLMAICWRGMDAEETLALTLAMRDSGKIIDLSGVSGIKIDKHSTGGVGDKTTLVLGPIVACCGQDAGLSCAMLSGRGLGHTGGTVDKLASIPGMRVELSEAEFIDCLKKIGFANSSQTPDICPADRKLYALRDITATVESVPLITASVMSKKLAGGADALVLDIKRGSGAFMKNDADAQRLADSLHAVGKAQGIKVRALITPMDEPLGWAIGNALEVMESAEILRGEHQDSDLAKLSFRLSAEMLILGGVAKELDIANEMVSNSIKSGRALEKFKEFISFCGGDPAALDDFGRLPQAPEQVVIPSPCSGTIKSIDSRALGIFAMKLGAGRRDQSDIIDPGAGMRVHVKVGNFVEKGQPLFTVYCRNKSQIIDSEILEAVVFIPSRNQKIAPRY